MARRLLFKKLILPPSGPLLVAFAGVALLTLAPRPGLLLVCLGLASLYLLSAPWFVARLLRTLDVYPHLAESPDFPTAGFINGGLIQGGQMASFPYLLAQQAGAAAVALPLVDSPGIGPPYSL